MIPAKYKGIRAYAIRIYAFLYSVWIFITAKKKHLEQDELTRMQVAELVYRSRTFDTYGFYNMEEFVEKIKEKRK